MNKRDELDVEYDGANLPDKMRGLRTCIPCTLVKTFTQFWEEGCENCPFLEMEQDRGRCEDCTTPHFLGMVGMMKPEDSWVARWQRIGKMKPGVYAMKVTGELPGEIEELLQENDFPNLGKMSQTA